VICNSQGQRPWDQVKKKSEPCKGEIDLRRYRSVISFISRLQCSTIFVGADPGPLAQAIDERQKPVCPKQKPARQQGLWYLTRTTTEPSLRLLPQGLTNQSSNPYQSLHRLDVADVGGGISFHDHSKRSCASQSDAVNLAQPFQGRDQS